MPRVKHRASRNRTLTCEEGELRELSKEILRPISSIGLDKLNRIQGKVIAGDTFEVMNNFPENFVDLLILDPPYNLSKNYNGQIFKTKKNNDYKEWFSKVIKKLIPSLKKTATIYVCSDWKTSILIAPILEENFNIRNRITWEREKGRGAKRNWKNNTEDIWFCTVSEDYFFDVDAVKIKKKVIAPYKINGQPKDWRVEKNGNYRLTYPSNIWTDVTVPFWSMPENTDHPTQKPEKLIAKLILASSKRGYFVFDPFLGSGTTAVVSKKLGRKFCGIELNEEYCCWAIKRLKMATLNSVIQGYEDGVFWERNSFPNQPDRRTQISRQEELVL